MDISSWVGPPSSTVFLSGAGISVDGPTSVPPGNGLTERALAHAFLDVDPRVLGDRFAAARMPGGFPRFETVLGCVAAAHHESGLAYLLADLVSPPPNDLHDFFARHIRLGGVHVTANIDTAIERAEAALGRGLGTQTVLHFHGAATGASGWDRLGIVLDLVESGFPDELRSRLDDALLPPRVRSIVVVGYSGSDYFDVGPYLVGLATGERLRGARVLWVDHDRADPSVRSVGTSEVPDSARITITQLDEAGAECVIVRGSTRRALNALGAAWGVAPMPEEPPARSPRWVCDPSRLSEQARLEATTVLLDRLGLVGALRDLAARRSEVASGRHADAVAQAHWEAGAYRDAERTWRTVWDGGTAAGRLRLDERIAACDWQRGRYRRAVVRLTRALDSAGSDDVTARLVLADTLARVVAHMSRFPDARLLSRRRLAVRALEALPTDAEVTASGLGGDALRRAAAARSKVDRVSTGGSFQDLNAEARAWQAQTSSVTRTLAYTQGELRERGRDVDERALDDYRWLRRVRQELGAHAGAMAVLTLPMAGAAFGVREVLRGLLDRRVEVTPYHRLRLIAGAGGLAVRNRRVGRVGRARR